MLTRSSTAMVLAAAVATVTLFACSNAADSLTARRGSASSRSGSGATEGDGGAGVAVDDSNERTLFAKVEPDLNTHCANGCHDTGTSAPAPKFLAGPDEYTSLKTHAGVITADVYSSILLTMGPHMGPAVSSLPDMQTKLIDWLNAEAAILASTALPSTDSFTVQNGTNTVDLTKAASGVTGVGLRFDAQLIGGMLQLTNVTLTTSAGSDVHILAPKFVRILAKANADGQTDIEDPADSFSNADQTVTAGKEALLSPGTVTFTADSWRPFDLANDKLRIEVTKLEVGKASTTAGQAQCKDPTGFAQNVLPTLRSSTTARGTCNSCHANGTGGLTLASNDAATVCQQVLGKLDKTDITKSLIITHTKDPNHGGGVITNAAAFQQLFTDNSGVFF